MALVFSAARCRKIYDDEHGSLAICMCQRNKNDGKIAQKWKWVCDKCVHLQPWASSQMK